LPLAASHRPHIVSVVRLIVVVDIAIVEIDVPRVVGVVGVFSIRPIVVGLGPDIFVHLLNRLFKRGQRNPIPSKEGYEFLHSHTI